MTCPNCDGEMVLLDPVPLATPPHHCPTCSRLWWDPEVTEQARALWSPARREFGTSEQAQMIHLQAEVALDMAREAGRDRRNRPPRVIDGDL